MIKHLLAVLALATFTSGAFAADVNKATAAELDAVKGIGPALSGRIIDERKKAPFKDWSDLMARVKGVGEGSAAKYSKEGLTVNGEERQRVRVDRMIFDIATLIASLSAGLTLEPGDIISTGTPAGVGFAMDPPQYLKHGDVVVSTIDRIGSLRNRIVEV